MFDHAITQIILDMSFHTGLTPTDEAFHTGLTPMEEVFHTGLTPTEESSHIGLTPTDETFHTGLTPIGDIFMLDFDIGPEPHNFAPTELQDLQSNFAPFEMDPIEGFSSILPSNQPHFLTTDNGLTTHTDSEIQIAARRNSLTDLVDHSLVAMPSFYNEILTYGQIVGPSQGLHSDNYLPSRPLNLLTAAGPVPGEPFSLQAQDPMNDLFMSSQLFNDNFGMNNQYGFMQQPPSAIAASYNTMLPVSDQFTAAPRSAVDSFVNPFDSNVFAGSDTQIMPHTKRVFSMPMMGYESAAEYAQRKESSSTNYSTNSPPLGVEKKLPPTEQTRYERERPAKPAGKPWVRVNASTQGKTSRTGKINQYDPEKYYSKVPHPTGAWRTERGKEFRYNQWHELSKNELTVSELKDFIYQHPKNKDCKLTLYIQRCPADSKRRYPTSTLDKCRLKDCPMRTYGNKGSFLHGHYRVALDELSYRYGKGHHNDPFQVAGYVHLYCLERFLDVPEICQLPHVRIEADARQIAKEPNGSFAPALSGGECRVAMNFIEAARKGNFANFTEWQNYPSQPKYRDTSNASRQAGFHMHRQTLNYALQVAKNGARGGRVMNRLKPSNVAVHRGDLEMYCLGRKNWLADEEVQQIEDELQQLDSATKNTGMPASDGKKRRRSSISQSVPASKRVHY